MAVFTFVSATIGESDGSSTTIASAAQNVSAGNLIEIGVRWEGGGSSDTTTVSSVADTIGNTYTPHPLNYIHTGAAEDEKIARFYCLASAGSNASNVVTVTLSAARTFRRIVSAQYSYTGGPIALGNTGSGLSATNATTFTQSTTALSVVNNDLVTGWIAWYDSGQTVAHTGYTTRGTFGGTVLTRFFEKVISGSPGTDTPNGSITGGDTYVLLTSVYQSAAGADVLMGQAIL